MSIDPGTCTGWAVWVDGVLHACGVERDPGALPIGGDLVVIEMPQFYRASKSKGDPNELAKLMRLVGRYEERALVAGARVELPVPHAWKGSAPKHIHNRRVVASLTAYEAKVARLKSYSKDEVHNLVDALGLGKWRLQQAA